MREVRGGAGHRGPRRPTDLDTSRHRGLPEERTASPPVPPASRARCLRLAPRRPWRRNQDILHWRRPGRPADLCGLGRPPPRNATRPSRRHGAMITGHRPDPPGVPGAGPEALRGRIRPRNFGCFRAQASHELRPRLKQGEMTIILIKDQSQAPSWHEREKNAGKAGYPHRGAPRPRHVHARGPVRRCRPRTSLRSIRASPLKLLRFLASSQSYPPSYPPCEAR